MKRIKSLGLFIAILSLTGCDAIAQMQQEWVQENCNITAAHNKGMSDGLTPGISPNRDYAAQCPMNNAQLNEAYLNGYTKALRARRSGINVNINNNSPQTTSLSDNFPKSSWPNDGIN